MLRENYPEIHTMKLFIDEKYLNEHKRNSDSFGVWKEDLVRTNTITNAKKQKSIRLMRDVTLRCLPVPRDW